MSITENRTVLLNAALLLFSEKGYDGASVETLRKAAKLSNGSFFHLYPSKAALAADLLVASVADYQGAVLQPLRSGVDANTDIAGVIQAKFAWVAAHPERTRFMLGEARAAWFALATEQLTDLNDRFSRVVDAWRAPYVTAGALAPMPIDLFVATLVGPANLIARHWSSGLRAAPTADETAELVAAAQRALGGGAPTGPASMG